MLGKKDKLRFLHIPKSAGSSFDEGLFALYIGAYLLRRRFIFTGNIERDRQRYLSLSPAKRGNIALYLGHAPRTTGILEVDQLPTITLLRDPVERVKSFCQHVSEGKSSAMGLGRTGPDMDLDDFLASGRIQLSNFQTRILLGENSYQLPQLDEGALVDSALQVLQDGLASFGLTEEFNRSMLLFQHTLGWKNAPPYRIRNTRNPRSLLRFEQRHVDKITELNKVDLRVYGAAQKIFRQRITDLFPDICVLEMEYAKALAKPHPVFTFIDMARSIRGNLRRR